MRRLLVLLLSAYLLLLPTPAGAEGPGEAFTLRAALVAEVVGREGDLLRIRSLDGREWRVRLTEETAVRAPGRQGEARDLLVEGARLALLVEEEGEGPARALWVLVGPPSPLYPSIARLSIGRRGQVSVTFRDPWGQEHRALLRPARPGPLSPPRVGLIARVLGREGERLRLRTLQGEEFTARLTPDTRLAAPDREGDPREHLVEGAFLGLLLEKRRKGLPVVLKGLIKPPGPVTFAIGGVVMRPGGRTIFFFVDRATGRSFSTLLAEGAPAGEVVARVIGPPEVVFDWSREACEEWHVPDLAARAFRDHLGRVVLLASSSRNYIMGVGEDLNSVRPDCSFGGFDGRVLLSHGAEDPGSPDDLDPSRYNDREWLASPYTPDGQTVFALVHNEHHRGRPTTQECAYSSITFAVSTDGGRTFRHRARPPEHLVAAIPYPFDPDEPCVLMGFLTPTNIVRNPEDGYFYSLFPTTGYGAQEKGVCLARTRGLRPVKGWRAWDGTDFTVRFMDPYRDPGPPEEHVCTPVLPISMRFSLTYNTSLEEWVVLGLACRKGVCGVYYATSPDLLRWSPPRLLMEAPVRWRWEPGDPPPIFYPSLLDPDSPSRNFETTGRRPYLYFTRFNSYDGQRAGPDRDLVRVRVEFTRVPAHPPKKERPSLGIPPVPRPEERTGLRPAPVERPRPLPPTVSRPLQPIPVLWRAFPFPRPLRGAWVR